MDKVESDDVTINERLHNATTIINDEQNPPLAPGETLDGRYRIECELGQGGIGQVFLARVVVK